MTEKRVDEAPEASAPPPMQVANLPADVHKQLKFSAATDGELSAVSALRASSEPWAGR